jgi:hypothetical protein
MSLKGCNIKLIGMETEVDWQIAYEASKQVDGAQRITLTYETPDNDVIMTVEKVGHTVRIRKVK